MVVYKGQHLPLHYIRDERKREKKIISVQRKGNKLDLYEKDENCG